MGTHDKSIIDIVLIARDRKTNTDTRTWPVLRQQNTGEETPGITPLPLAGAVNPFDILQQAGAIPLLSLPAANPEDRDFLATPANGEITILDGDGHRYTLPADAARDALDNSLAATRRALAPYVIENARQGVTDPLLSYGFSPETDCTYHDFKPLFTPDGTGFIFTWLATLTCENDASMGPVSVILALKGTP
jgi:hypothetical protein